MDRQEAIDVLSKHNAWRRGNDDPQTDPTKLGAALDFAIAALRTDHAEALAEELEEAVCALEVCGKDFRAMETARAALARYKESRNG